MYSIAFGSPHSQLVTDFSHQVLKVGQNVKIYETFKISPISPNYSILFKFCRLILSSLSISIPNFFSKFQNFGAPNEGVKGQISKFSKSYSMWDIYVINRSYIPNFIEIRSVVPLVSILS